MQRQRGSELDIANAICSRTNRVIDFVSQHRFRLLMLGLYRTANSCKPGLLVGALRIAYGLWTETPLKTTQGAAQAAVKNRIACGTI